MATRTMTLARIRELDKKSEMEVHKFLRWGLSYGEPFPFFLHEEQAEQLSEMATKFGVPFEEFQTYVGVQKYIDRSSRTNCAELPSPVDIAQRLGIPFEEFNEYLLTKIKSIHDAYTDEEDDEEFALHIEPEEWDLKEDS